MASNIWKRLWQATSALLIVFCIFIMVASAVAPDWLKFRYYLIVNKNRALRIASDKQDEEEIVKLMKSGVSITQSLNNEQWSASMNYPYLYLRPEFVYYGFRHGANPNIKGVYGNTPLHYACATTHSRGNVAVLLDCGASPNALGQQNRTPLDFVKIENSKVLEAMLDKGACLSTPFDTQHDFYESQPYQWEQNGRARESVFPAQVPKTGIASKQETIDQLMDTAIRMGALQTALILLKYHPKPIDATPDASTPWIISVCQQSPDLKTKNDPCAQLLEGILKLGANINAKDPNTGDTALHIAVRAHNFELVKFLLNRGVDRTIKNADNKRAIDLLDPVEDIVR